MSTPAPAYQGPDTVIAPRTGMEPSDWRFTNRILAVLALMLWSFNQLGHGLAVRDGPQYVCLSEGPPQSAQAGSRRRRMVRKRGVWLSVLFVGQMLTATAMGAFEMEIEKAVVLALFGRDCEPTSLTPPTIPCLGQRGRGCSGGWTGFEGVRGVGQVSGGNALLRWGAMRFKRAR